MPTWRRSPMARERALWARATALCAPVKALLFGPSIEFDEMPFVEDDALRLRVACALVIDAQHGWPAEHRLDTKALQVWEFYHTVPVKIIRYFTVFAYLLIAFAETPGWCVALDGSEIANCTNATTFQRYETLADWAVLPTAWALFLEGVCLSVFTAQLVARMFMLGVRRFLRSRWHLLQLLLLVFMFADVLMAASPALWKRTHFTRPMRAAFVVCSHRRLRDTSAAIVLMMPRMLEVLVLFAGLLLFAAWVATLCPGIATSSPSASDDAVVGFGFDTLTASLTSLALLLTSTNFPDVALPAYKRNRASILFFIAIQWVLVFVGLNLVLALIYRSYCAHMRAEARALSRNRRHAMRTAYRQLCGAHMPSAQLSSLALTHANFAELLHRLRPDLLPWQVGLCFEALDRNQRGVLELNEFEGLLAALQVQFEVAPSLEHARRHRLRLKLRALLADWRTTLALDGAVVLNTLLIALQQWQRKHGHGDSCSAQLLPQLPFLLLWLVQSALHVGALGWVRGLLLGWHGFDALVTVASYISVPVLLATGCHPEAAGLQAIQAIAVLRAFRLLRLLSLVPSFRLFLSAIYAMRTPFLTFFTLLAAFLYIFAAIGMELLGGVWYRDAPCLEGLNFDKLGYYRTHFNDFPSAMVTTWALLMVNNYWVYMDAAFNCIAHAQWWQVAVYFLAFYFCLVFFLSTLLTSFVLESVLTFFDRADAGAAAAAAHAAAHAAAAASEEQTARCRGMGGNASDGSAAAGGPEPALLSPMSPWQHAGPGAAPGAGVAAPLETEAPPEWSPEWSGAGRRGMPPPRSSALSQAHEIQGEIQGRYRGDRA